MGRITTIPFGQCFLKTLAHAIKQQGLFQEDVDASVFGRASMHVWLPTNRSVLGLKESLLNVNAGKTSFVLPMLSSFTDLESKNPFALKEIHALPPAIGVFERLALMMDFLPASFPVQKAYAVAHYLMTLHDECIIGDVSVESLESFYEEQVFETAPDHVKDAYLNLNILTCRMPKALLKRGLVIESWRRQQAIRYLAEHIAHNPPEHPIVMAGTTGTVPATRALLKAVYDLPKGMIILPGLDGADDKTRVQGMRSHPQHTLFDVCRYLGVEPFDISSLTVDTDVLERARHHDIQSLFKAPPLSQKKQTEGDAPTLIECTSQAEEARVITAIVREHVFETDHSIAIVTPSQRLMTCLKAEMSLFGIVPNDSAGIPLCETPVGHFLKGLADFIKAPSAATFIHLSKHPLSAKSNRQAHLRCIRRYERMLRRKQLPWDNDTEMAWIRTLHAFIHQRTECTNFYDFVRFFKKMAEVLSDDTVFNNHDGESAAAFFDNLLKTPPFIRRDFDDALILLMEMAAPVHNREGLGSRVRILGTLEARLNTADVIICASMNEGNWPKTPESDPLLSDGFRVAVGLPSKKRQQGLAAHDFCTSFYAKHLYVIRSIRDGGEAMLESRLWTRLKHYYGIRDTRYRRIANYQPPSTAVPITAPEPTPHATLRPKTYFASHVECLMRDPYAFYVRYMLRLTPFPLLDEALSAKDKGQTFHAILDHYLTHEVEPKEEKLLAFAKPYFDTLSERGGGIAQTFWWYRFKRIAAWWHAKLDVEPALLRQTEVSGEALLPLGHMTVILKSRADRIEVVQAKDDVGAPKTVLRIIDYKTGTLPTQKSIKDGTSPQLLVEAVIARNHGFGDKFPQDVETFNLEYWRLTGGEPAGVCLHVQLNQDDCIKVQSAMLNALGYFLKDDTPYLASGVVPDVRYLARMEEWE